MGIHDNLPVTLGAALAVTLGLSAHAWTQGENPPEQGAPAPADKPLRADPANDLFQLALHSYREAGEVKEAQRMKETYLAAIRQFDRFRARFPAHPNAIKARYYKAICHRKVGDMKGFRECLEEVVNIHEKGVLVGAAAYQLAFEHYQAKEFAEAEPFFRIAAAETDNADYRHRALYSRALCFEKLGKRKEAIAALKDILADAGSPFKIQAERVLAHYYAKADMEEEALAHFMHLAKSQDNTTRADAILQCAQIARKLGKKDFARTYFEQILSTPGLEQWQGEAQLTLMSEASLASRHQDVINYFKRGDYPLDKEPLSRRLQIAATSYEALGQEEQATTLFKELARIAPDNMTALEASYLVLSRDYKTGSRNLIQQAGEFLKRFEKEHPDDTRIHNTRLMLAESYHQSTRYELAARAYAAIDLQHIATGNHAGLRYRLANAQLKAGDQQRALASFNTFIEKHSTHPQVNNAIVNRAEIFLELKNSAQAHLEFDRLIRQTSKPTLKEYAWAQKAILYKEVIDTTGDEKVRLENLDKFADCHARLLSDFPRRENDRKATSEFWRGWALYRQNKFADCITPFQQARTGDASALGRTSTLHLALAHYHLQQREELRKELDTLLENYRDEKVPRPVFAWLGNAYYKDELYADAWTYLSHAITPDKPTETKVVIWRAAGRSALEAGAYEAALRPLEIVLQVEDNQYRRAETHFFLGRAHLALKDTERAHKDTEDCLSLKPQGSLNSRARLQLGDIAMAQGDPNAAAQSYVPVVELYSKDPIIAEKALQGAIRALDFRDTEGSRRTAKRYRERLQELRNATKPPSRD